CLFWLGRWRELVTEAPTTAAEAALRGYHYVSANVVGQSMSLAELMRGDIAAARQHIDSVQRGEQGEPSPVERFFYHSWLVRTDLADSDPKTALARADGLAVGFLDGLVLRAPIIRFIDMHDRLSISLAALRAGQGSAGALRRRARAIVGKLAHPD